MKAKSDVLKNARDVRNHLLQAIVDAETPHEKFCGTNTLIKLAMMEIGYARARKEQPDFGEFGRSK